MSSTFSIDVKQDELVEFLLDEHRNDTGIPVHPFSAVRCAHPCFERSVGITDGNGTLFYDSKFSITAYGCNNDFSRMLRVLTQCGVTTEFTW